MPTEDRAQSEANVLQYDGAETHQDPIEGEVTRHYWDCPSCGFPIAAWMDCPDCGWYDEDVWAGTLSKRGGTA